MARVLILAEPGVEGEVDLVRQLAEAGHDVSTSHGEADLAVLLVGSPPGAAAVDLREQCPDLPLVLVSTAPRCECAAAIIRLRAVACLPSPVSAELLAAACARALEEGTRARQLREYRLLIEHQSDLVVRFGPDCRLRYASPTYCRAFGRTEADLLGEDFTPLIHPDDASSTGQALATLAAPPHASRHRERARTVAGWRWFEWAAHGVVDRAGTVIEIVSVGRDITEQVEAEERAARYQLDLQRAQELAQLGMWSYDPATCRVAWSDTMFALLGLEVAAEPPDFDRVRAVVHRDDWAQVSEAMRRAVGEGIGYRLETRITRPDGERRRLAVTCDAERDADGHVLRLVGSVQDMTTDEQTRQRIEGLAQFPAQNPNPVLRIGADGTILFANEASAPLLHEWGVAEKGFLPVALRQPVARALSDRQLQRVETPCGAMTYASVLAPMRGEESVNIYGLDISDLRAAEDRATRLQAFYRAILENVHDGIWVSDAEDRLVFANAAMERIAGVSREHLLDKDLEHGFPPETARELALHYRQAKESLRPVEYEIRIMTSGGRDTVQTGWLIPRLRGGLFDGMICTTQDITERVLAAQELRLKSDAIENAINGFEILAEDGTFVYVNQAHLRMWGYDSLADVLGVSAAGHCVDPTVPARIRRELQEHGQWTMEFAARRRDGSVFDVLMAAYLHHDADGRELYMGSCLDISERKRAEEAAARQHEELEAAVRERTSDLRTIVNSMAGREVRMAELKNDVRALRRQLIEQGLRPVVDDPLGAS